MFPYLPLENGPIPMKKTFPFLKTNLTELNTHLEGWLEAELHKHGIQPCTTCCKSKSNILISFLEVLSHTFIFLVTLFILDVFYVGWRMAQSQEKNIPFFSRSDFDFSARFNMAQCHPSRTKYFWCPRCSKWNKATLFNMSAIFWADVSFRQRKNHDIHVIKNVYQQLLAQNGKMVKGTTSK